MNASTPLRTGEIRRSPVGDIIILRASRNVVFVRADHADGPYPDDMNMEAWPVVREPVRVMSPRGPATLLDFDLARGARGEHRVAYDDARANEWVGAAVVTQWERIS